MGLLVKGLGLRKRAPKRQGVLEMYFQQQLKIGMRVNWRKALGKDLRPIEQRCLRLQRWMIGDPSARIMSLDTFNESLVQAFSMKHPTLKVEYKKSIGPGKAVPDYGQWLQYKNALRNALPNAITWLTDVHKLRVKVDLAHAKDQKTGAHTRPISFKEANTLFKGAQAAWAELIREWIKLL